MPWLESLQPVRMQRVAVVVAAARLTETVREVGAAGVVDFDDLLSAKRSAGNSTGEEADRMAGEAVHRGSAAALAGWCPDRLVPALSARLAGLGASVVRLPVPLGLDPPTLLPQRGSASASFRPLVSTYGTVPYPNVDPTLLAGLAYAVMFGMMFGDAGHGLLLALGALVLRTGRPRLLARWRSMWVFVGAAGLASAGFGLLYGEFFGPTGLVPVWWLAPLQEPVTLLAAGIGVGAVLLAAAYAAAIVNRWREGGAQLAVYASSGIAGATVFLGIGGLAGGLYLRAAAIAWAGAAVIAVGLLLAGAGFKVAAGPGAAGYAQAAIQVVDVLVRIATNLISFARLAAFGLVHAALGELVWKGTTGLAGLGGLLATVGAAVLFLAGNALSFAVESVIAAIQALRLTFYELFSRIFETQGRPYRPWQLPGAPLVEPASPLPAGPAPRAADIRRPRPRTGRHRTEK
ncbi:V-type ATPase 116kDa subunit family protein [Amycolatopsis benzoatilytica]|uniref:V-type ATPase 116kDa subunit family protein n=1 Tax=Amycolatopsis benzoatilytica TaxID=346045 RepID=UPI00036238C8|nr:V-type ATPase 116kDa subunit family protein [Amycolatopsis benzoatilytica]